MATKKKAAPGTSTLSTNGNRVATGTSRKIKLDEPLPSANGHSDSFDKKELLRILTEVKNGNFSSRMPIDETGINGKICDTLNEIIGLNEKMMQEFTKAGNTIGKKGKLTQRIEAPSGKGSWRTGIESLNTLI